MIRINLREFAFGGLEQALSLVGAELRQLVIFARHQSFIWEVRMFDLEEIARIEQPQLKTPIVEQRANLSRLESRDPCDAVELTQYIDLPLRDHPAVSHDHHLL